MALQATDLLIVQRNQQSYKMPASEISSFVPPAPNVGNGTITIVQPGTTNQTFTVNQTGNTTITLKNDDTNTQYIAGNGLSLSGTTFSAKAGNNTITVDSGGIKVNTGNLGINPGTVTSITPGEGIRNGSSSGAANSTAITSSGSLSVDDTVVRTSGDQTMSGSKTFSSTSYHEGGIRQTVRTINNSAAWNMATGNMWVSSATTIANPSNVTAGMTGVIFFTSSPTSWGSYYKFPGGSAPDFEANSVVPYYVKTSNEVLIGFPTGAIA